MVFERFHTLVAKLEKDRYAEILFETVLIENAKNAKAIAAAATAERRKKDLDAKKTREVVLNTSSRSNKHNRKTTKKGAAESPAVATEPWFISHVEALVRRRSKGPLKSALITIVQHFAKNAPMQERKKWKEIFAVHSELMQTEFYTETEILMQQEGLGSWEVENRRCSVADREVFLFLAKVMATIRDLRQARIGSPGHKDYVRAICQLSRTSIAVVGKENEAHAIKVQQMCCQLLEQQDKEDPELTRRYNEQYEAFHAEGTWASQLVWDDWRKPIPFHHETEVVPTGPRENLLGPRAYPALSKPTLAWTKCALQRFFVCFY